MYMCFFFSSRRRHTRFKCDWSSDVCSSDLSHTHIYTHTHTHTQTHIYTHTYTDTHTHTHKLTYTHKHTHKHKHTHIHKHTHTGQKPKQKHLTAQAMFGSL